MQIDEVSDAKDVVRGQDANSRKQKSFKWRSNKNTDLLSAEFPHDHP
jgi:hypothetical protein